jgi:excisionase family DNA binding protein
MVKNEYLSISQFAKILGVSRIAIYKKIKKGQIEAIRIGRSFVIPRKYLTM